MNTRQLLVNREWQIDGNWYSAREKIRSYKSVEYAELFNTMSSAGDWEGYLVQRIGNKRYLIIFSQENNWPYAGFTAYTGEPMVTWKGRIERDKINDIISELYDLQFNTNTG